MLTHLQMQYGECLHGVGSFKGSMFPQSIGLAASFDVDLVRRVGEAIGAEARSIGIHACLSPVLDLGLEPRWVVSKKHGAKICFSLHTWASLCLPVFLVMEIGLDLMLWFLW